MGRLNPLELWGGVECTINRIGDEYRDQLRLTGHKQREGDLDLVARLGLTALRYPVLWESIAPSSPHEFDWVWCDRRLGRLRHLGVRPIAGLIHHGSGPRYTSLVDESFAPGLAVFGAAAARRYPWIEDWTPVNEPLTTARFSCLYGHWYPHARDERLFWTALLNQVDATRLTMRAIREVTPAARLIQTEDLGRTYATAALAEQAAFDNVRRWGTWDLLAGRVVPGHDLWKHLCGFGFERRLRHIANDPCPADLIGINHYLTSDRFLDHRIQRYPQRCRGGNGRQPYADVEAIRVLGPQPSGLQGAIDEAWDRYRLPIALTEVHNGCSREEQLRWFDEAWRGALDARERGIDLRAVTCWALFGSSGWNTLLTGEGRYEPGAFDVRGGEPRPTALARLLAALPGQGRQHRVAEAPGWWRRGLRLHHPPAPTAAKPASYSDRGRAPTRGAPILITGATGTLGQAMAAACRHRKLAYVLTRRPELDLLDEASIALALDANKPWAVIDCAGWVRVDEAEGAADACMAINAFGAVALARECDSRGIHSVSFSSDLVFGGGTQSAYVESDPAAPRNVYGASKAQMERAIAALPGDHLVIRSAAFFSPFDEHNFAIELARTLSCDQRFTAAGDHVVTPTYVPDLCDAALDLVIDAETGIWHLANQEALSWADFARRLAHGLGRDGGLIDEVPGSQMGWRAKRPRASPIASERGNLLPPLQTAIDRFCLALAGRKLA